MKILIQYSEYSIKYNYYKCKELLKSNSNYEFGLIGKTAHHVDERVSIRDIELLSKIYKEFLDNSLYFGKNDVS